MNASSPPLKIVLNTISVVTDGDEYLPVNDSAGGYELKVGPETEEFAIPPRMSFIIDGGLALEFDQPTQVFVQTDISWAKRGLLLTSVTSGTGSQRLQFVGYNVGKQILAFELGETIGRFFLSSLNSVALVPTVK